MVSVKQSARPCQRGACGHRGNEVEALMPRGEFDRSARKAQTRRRLLEAAARVYARRGFNGATLEEVAAEAGFTKGAVYGHFGSKENLLLALMEEHLTPPVIEQSAPFARARSTLERPLAAGPKPLRVPFARFATAIALDPGLEPPAHSGEQFSNVILALGLVMPM